MGRMKETLYNREESNMEKWEHWLAKLKQEREKKEIPISIFSKYPYHTSENRKPKCTCGAAYTSFPNLHMRNVCNLYKEET